MLTHEHVQHLTRRNDTLAQKIEKLKGRSAHVAKHAFTLLEVTAGAAAGGLIQGLAKDQSVGPRIAKVPADLGIGLALEFVGVLDLAGEEYSSHIANLGTGFLAAYFTDLGHAIGSRKRTTGHYFGPKATAALPAVSGDVSPQQMAEALLSQMQQRQA